MKLVRVLTLLTMCLAFAGITFGQNLTFWHYWDGANGQVLQGLIDRYEEENPGVSIEAVFVPGSELVTRLQTAIAGRQTPTMAISDLVAMPLLTSSGVLAPLNEYIASSNVDMDDYFEGPLVYGLRDGSRYSLPVSASNLGLFWNKALFEEAGLDPETPPQNWDELMEFSKTINERTGVVGLELFTQGGEGTSWQWQVYLWSAGGEMLSEDLSEPAFNSEAGEKALSYWVDLVNEGGSNVAPWGLFGRGEAGMVMDGSWMTQFFPMQVSFELGSAVFPHSEAGGPATNMGGEQAFIFEGEDETKQAAWDFIEWFSSTPVQVEWDRGTGFMPIKHSVANDQAYVAWVKNARPLLLPFVESMQYARARPPVENYPQISDTLANYIVEAVYGRMSPEEALDAAAGEVAPLLR
ncbi:MAG: ABC transporter substrate-binding protein [Trueperaceae bacterium]